MIEYDKQIDEDNIRIFKEEKTYNPYEMRHKCCICKRPTSIGGSYSNKGHKLVCMRCQYEKFGGNPIEMYEFIEEE